MLDLWWICAVRYTYINLIVELGLEGVGTLRDTSIEIIWLVMRQVMRANWCHGKTADTSDSTSELKTLAIGILNLKLVRMIAQYIATDASISCKGLRMAHMLTCWDGCACCSVGFAAAPTTTLLSEERIRNCCHNFATHEFCQFFVLSDFWKMQ